MDETIAHVVVATKFKETFITYMCGGLGKHFEERYNIDHYYIYSWNSAIVLWDCMFQAKKYVLYFLCKLDQTVNPLKSGVKSPWLNTSASSFGFHFTSCPFNYTTHSFLACDVHADCWGSSDIVQFGAEIQNWDIPFASSCPVPGMTSLPPSYACDANGARVPYTFVCDHRQDCGDNSDESFCLFSSCQEHRAQQCGDIKQCYTDNQYCDGQVDCVNEVDESNCPVPSEEKEHHQHPSSTVGVIDFVKNGSTIITPLHSFQACPDTHYQCAHDEHCLPVFTRCNGLYDCADHEDETHCDIYACSGFYRCFNSRVCVHPSQVCDGINHCPRSDDELLCNQHCPQQCICHGQAFTCPRPFSAHSYPELRYLNGRGSRMTVFEVSGNNMLVYLSLADCHLKNASNVTLSNIVTLDISFNKLHSIPQGILLNSGSLKSLFLSGNPIAGYLKMNAIKSFPKVRTLDLSQTILYTLDFYIVALFPEVTFLNLSHSDMYYVNEEGFQPMSKLQVLDLKGCPLLGIDKNLLRGLDQLRTIYADSYKICCTTTLFLDLINCHSPQDELSSCQDLLRSNFYRICLSLFSFLALIGNGASFVFRMASLKGSGSPGFSVLVLHLCVSDFLMGIYLAIVGIADKMYHSIYVWEDRTWRHSAPCKLAGFLSLLSCEVSSFLICLITLDRFLVVRFPSSFLHFRGWDAQLAAFLSWVTGFVLAVVPLLPAVAHWEFYSQTGICIPLPVTRKMFGGQNYSFGIMIVLNSILFQVIALGQVVIYWSIQSNTITGGMSSQHSQDASIARRLFTVVMSDFLCWFPVGLLGILASQGVSVSGELNIVVAILVMPLNSALNPFLYTLNLLLEKRQKQTEERLLKLLVSPNC